MLARALGAAPRRLYAGSVSGGPPPPKAGAVSNGTCGTTGYNQDCATRDAGAWNTTADGIKTLAECAARCMGCARCEFVSFLLKHEDCSW